MNKTINASYPLNSKQIYSDFSLIPSDFLSDKIERKGVICGIVTEWRDRDHSKRPTK